MPDRIVFDIETCARPDAIEFLPEPKPAGNLKDPAKIADSVEYQRNKRVREAALDPDTAQVVAIGMTLPGKQVVHLLGDPETPTEEDLIDTFWHSFRTVAGYAIGYNILGFDLPFLLRRSMALGITPYLRPDLRRYVVRPITDLYAILYNWGPGKSLETVAHLYGLYKPLGPCYSMPPGGPASGEELANLYNTDPERLRNKCMTDICLTEALYHRMNGVYF